jgi:hypothetical protein
MMMIIKDDQEDEDDVIITSGLQATFTQDKKLCLCFFLS